MRLFESMLSHSNDSNSKNVNSSWDNMERKDSMEKLPKPVYYIESPNDDTVLIGINVTIEHNIQNNDKLSKISWYDTSHERSMLASETNQKDDYFEFKRIEQEGGGEYFFTPINLDIYNEKVKQYLAAGSDFNNEEDLIEAFLSTTEDEV